MIKFKKNMNYFCRIYISYENKILTRLKFGLNIGNIKDDKKLLKAIYVLMHMYQLDLLKIKKHLRGLLLNKNNSKVLISN